MCFVYIQFRLQKLQIEIKTQRKRANLYQFRNILFQIPGYPAQIHFGVGHRFL